MSGLWERCTACRGWYQRLGESGGHECPPLWEARDEWGQSIADVRNVAFNDLWFGATAFEAAEAAAAALAIAGNAAGVTTVDVCKWSWAGAPDWQTVQVLVEVSAFESQAAGSTPGYEPGVEVEEIEIDVGAIRVVKSRQRTKRGGLERLPAMQG